MSLDKPTRREFLAAGAAAAAGLATAPAAYAGTALPNGDSPSGALRFYHVHTSEKLRVRFRRGNALITSALGEIDHLLRDFRTGDEVTMDLGLLDTLSLLYDRFGRQGWYEVVSGYRSPRTNEALRRITDGVDENSFHLQGRAIDVRLVGIETERFRDAAAELAMGGVGFYPDSNFVHLDNGTVRTWESLHK